MPGHTDKKMKSKKGGSPWMSHLMKTFKEGKTVPTLLQLLKFTPFTKPKFFKSIVGIILIFII